MTKNGRPRGFGFVSFSSPECATAALAVPQWLDGRYVDVKRAVPGETAQDRHSSKIFVGGLPQDATTEDLRTYFAGFGPVSDAVVMVDRRTKRSRGFGFVRFASGAEGGAAAEKVLASSTNPRLGGKAIEVKRAMPAALLRELSPCGDKSAASCAPVGLSLAEQQLQQACAYYECFASGAPWADPVAVASAMLGGAAPLAWNATGAGAAAVAAPAATTCRASSPEPPLAGRPPMPLLEVVGTQASPTTAPRVSPQMLRTQACCSPRLGTAS